MTFPQNSIGQKISPVCRTDLMASRELLELRLAAQKKMAVMMQRSSERSRKKTKKMVEQNKQETEQAKQETEQIKGMVHQVLEQNRKLLNALEMR